MTVFSVKGLWQRVVAHRNFLPLLVLLSGLSLTVLVWGTIRSQEYASGQRQFAVHSDEVLKSIEARMRQHEQILIGAEALFEASESVLRDEWQAYVKRLELGKDHPGILGVGYAERVHKSGLQAHIDAVRAEGFPDYDVKVGEDSSEFFPTVYIEPFSGTNVAAFGFDLLSSSERATALRRAGETGSTAITEKTSLLQGGVGGAHIGFLMYVPVYRRGLPLETPEQRWSALQGVVYSAYRVSDMLKDALSLGSSGLAFSIFDGKEVRLDRLLYEKGHDYDENGVEIASDFRPMFAIKRTLSLYGHQWMIDLHSTPRFEEAFKSRLSIGILFLMGSTSILLAILVRSLSSRRESATRLAEQMTQQIRRNEASLALTATRLQSILDTAVDGIITADGDGIIETFNPAAEQMFGYRADEMIGRSFQMLVKEPLRKKNDISLVEDFRTGKTGLPGLSLEVSGCRKGGEHFPMEMSESLMEFQGEQHLISIVRDITSRKRTEAMVARSVKELADFKAALDAHAKVLTTNAQGIITYANEAFCQMTQYSREELIGRSPKMLNSGDQPKEFFENLWRTIKSGSIWKGEVTNRAKNGDLYWVDTTIVPFLDEKGRPVQYISIRSDITKRVLGEQALLAARDAADAANSAKDAFLATMSHEIRTPLNGLLGTLELLGMTQLDPDQQESLEIARDSGRGLVRLIDDVLDHAKIESGKLEIRPEPSSLADLVHRVVRTYHSLASAKGLLLTEVIDPRINQQVQVDPLRMMQVLSNFISNAVKFTAEGYIEVRADLVARAEDAITVRVSVKDTGIGIAPAEQQRMFMPFEQAGPDISRLYGGTGLGLSISRRLAEMMGGEVGMESEEGVGTTMHLTLKMPLVAVVLPTAKKAALPVKVHMTENTPEKSNPAVVSLEGAWVLAVDDHPTNRNLLLRQLSVLGVRAQTASDGMEALSLWRSGAFDMVITDCNMPRMDGYTLSSSIREIEQQENRPRTPIIAWTANVLASSLAQCQAAGMDEVLTKPVEIALLKEMLLRWLPKKELSVKVVELKQVSVTAPVDLSGFNLIASDIEDEVAILQDFLAQTRLDLDELEKAVFAGRGSEICQIAHRMKGASRMIGARELSAACAAMEESARQGGAVGVGAVTKAIAAIEAYLSGRQGSLSGGA